MKIEWKEPPESSREYKFGGKYLEFANALRSKPGTWALFRFQAKTPPGSVAWQINAGKQKSFAVGEFQAVSRSGEVYVRFVGKKLRAVKP